MYLRVREIYVQREEHFIQTEVENNDDIYGKREPVKTDAAVRSTTFNRESSSADL